MKLVVWTLVVLAIAFVFFIMPSSEVNESEPPPRERVVEKIKYQEPVVETYYFTVPAMGSVDVPRRGFSCKADNVRNDQSITYEMFPDKIVYTSKEKEATTRRIWLHNHVQGASCRESYFTLKEKGYFK